MGLQYGNEGLVSLVVTMIVLGLLASVYVVFPVGVRYRGHTSC